MKKISEIIEKNYNILIYIPILLFLFYPFNVSIREIVLPNDLILMFILFLSSVLFFVLNYSDIKKNCKRNILPIIIILSLILIILIRNGDIKNGHYGMPYFTIISLLNLIILINSKKWYDAFINVLFLYSFQHVIYTLVFKAFPDFYLENILPLFPDFEKELLYQFNHQQMAGLTFHYSTNALYLTVSLFVTFYKFYFSKIKTKKNTIYIIMFILSFLAILLTGKRVHLFFSILCLGFIYLLNNRNKIKKSLLKLSVSFITLISLLLILSSFIPGLTGSITRLLDSIKNGDIFDSRKPMYELAIQLFEDEPIIGNGWGTYKYEYNSLIENKEREYMDAHSIYLQLLSEIGIIGTIYILGIIILLLIITLKKIKSDNSYNKYLYFSLIFQIFIILDGMVGNAIYDAQEIMPYLILVGVAISASNDEQTKYNIEGVKK